MISLQKLRTLIDVTIENDAEITMIRDAVVQDFKTCTRRFWTSGSYSEEMKPGFECDSLFVRGYPILTITVSERDDKADSWTALVADTDYEWNPYGQINNLRDASWLKYVKIDYTGGYADDAAPADVLYALALEIRRILFRDASERIGLDSQLLSDNGTTKYLDNSKRHPMYSRAIEKYKNRTMI